jgi:hypothetical protein
VHLVGDHRRQAERFGQLGELRGEPVVVGLQVVRQLDGEVAVGEVPCPPARGVAGRLGLAGEQVTRNLAVAAAGEADQVAAGAVERRGDQGSLEDRELLLAGEMRAAGQA